MTDNSVVIVMIHAESHRHKSGQTTRTISTIFGLAHSINRRTNQQDGLLSSRSQSFPELGSSRPSSQLRTAGTWLDPDQRLQIYPGTTHLAPLQQYGMQYETARQQVPTLQRPPARTPTSKQSQPQYAIRQSLADACHHTKLVPGKSNLDRRA